MDDAGQGSRCDDSTVPRAAPANDHDGGHEAVQGGWQQEGNKISGMVVLDDEGQLVGILSMYDILPQLRPAKNPQWESMDDQEVDAFLDAISDRIKTTQIQSIMSRDVITITPDTHVAKILDIMIRRHIRRLPVVEGREVVGMVTLTTVFDHLGDRLLTH